MRNGLGLPQSVLVLGGGSDIGVATARALVARRARTVILAGRHPDALEGTAAELRGVGADRVDVVAFDARDVSSHAAFVEDVFARHGDIDVVLFAFGVLGDQAQAEKDADAAIAMVETNCVGAVSVGVHVANRMRLQGHGALVVLSSVAAERPRRSNFVYGASKAGADAFFTGVGDALVGSGVRVLVVRPGFVHTKMTTGLPPAPFSTTPDEVAAAIVRALETGAEEIWVPAKLRAVMSLLRHVPRAVFRKLPL